MSIWNEGSATDPIAFNLFQNVSLRCPLKRVIQREVANRLAEQILAGFVREGDTVEIDALPDGSGVTLTTDAATPTEDAVPTNGHAAEA